MGTSKIINIAILLAYLVISQIAQAQIDKELFSQAQDLLGNSQICQKTATPLPKGAHNAKLANYPSTPLYSGPSVVCPKIGSLTRSIAFVVLGSTKSTFNQSWFYVRISGSRQAEAWVPSKYVTLGAPKEYASKPIPETKVQLKSNLNVRECPDTACRRVALLRRSDNVIASRHSTNNWYYIKSGNASGWVSGLHVEVISADISKAPEMKRLPTTTDATNSKQNNFAKPDTESSLGNPQTSSQSIAASSDSNSKSISIIPQYNETTHLTEEIETNKPRKTEITPAQESSKDQIDPCTQGEVVLNTVSRHLWRTTKSFEANVAASPECIRSETIEKHAALINIGEGDQFIKIAYLGSSDSLHQTGYISKNRFTDLVTEKEEVPPHFREPEIEKLLVTSQQYFQSWHYAISEAWKPVSRLYERHPIFMSILLMLIMIGPLYAWSKTRPLIIQAGQYILQIATAVLTAIYTLFADVLSIIRDALMKAKLRDIVSNWNTMIEGLNVAPSDFYTALENRLKEKQLAGASVFKLEWREGGILSPYRLYLRVSRKDHAFDICAAPFGNGMFFSWWLGELPRGLIGLMYRIPFIAWLAYFYDKTFRPMTYYRLDTMSMFQSLVHSAVLEVIDGYTSEEGLRSVENDERKPMMKEFFNLKR